MIGKWHVDAFDLGGKMLKGKNEMEVLACCLLWMAGCKGERTQVRAAINRLPGRQGLGTHGRDRRLRRSDMEGRENAPRPNL